MSNLIQALSSYQNPHVIKNPKAVKNAETCTNTIIATQDINFILEGLVDAQINADQRGKVQLNGILSNQVEKIR